MARTITDNYDRLSIDEGWDESPTSRDSTWLTTGDVRIEEIEPDYLYVKEGHPSSVTHEELLRLERCKKIVLMTIPEL